MDRTGSLCYMKRRDHAQTLLTSWSVECWMQIGKMMIQSLGLDLDPITQALKDCKVRTFPEPPKGVPQA